MAPLTAGVGFSAIGALTYYVALLSGLCVLFTLPLYPLASYLGHLSVAQFARAAAPSQAVALSTQSSLASLPTMIAGAETRLCSPPQVVGVVLPLAVSVFRYSTPIWLIVAALLVAKLYGIDLVASQTITVAGLSVRSVSRRRPASGALVLRPDHSDISLSAYRSRPLPFVRGGYDPGHGRNSDECDRPPGDSRCGLPCEHSIRWRARGCELIDSTFTTVPSDVNPASRRWESNR